MQMKWLTGSLWFPVSVTLIMTHSRSSLTFFFSSRSFSKVSLSTSFTTVGRPVTSWIILTAGHGRTYFSVLLHFFTILRKWPVYFSKPGRKQSTTCKQSCKKRESYFYFQLSHLHDLPVGLPAPVTYHHGRHHTAAAAPSLDTINKKDFNSTMKINPEGNRFNTNMIFEKNH